MKTKNIESMVRLFRYLWLPLVYCFVSILAFCFSYNIRFDGSISGVLYTQMIGLLPLVVVVQVLVLYFTGQTRVLPAFYSVIDIKSQVLAAFVSSFGLLYLLSYSKLRSLSINMK